MNEEPPSKGCLVAAYILKLLKEYAMIQLTHLVGEL